MPRCCTPLPGGGFACGSKPRQKRCDCGRPATLLCDWKVKRKGEMATCDHNICKPCSTSPAEGKDLCKPHALVWEAMGSPRP